MITITRKVVKLDDGMTMLDVHLSDGTVEEIRTYAGPAHAIAIYNKVAEDENLERIN